MNSFSAFSIDERQQFLNGGMKSADSCILKDNILPLEVFLMNGVFSAFICLLITLIDYR